MTVDEIRDRNRAKIRPFLEAWQNPEEMYAKEGVKSIPFMPPSGWYWHGIEAIKNNAEANGEQFSDFVYDSLIIHDCLDPTEFWVETEGHGKSHLEDDAVGEVISNEYSASYIDYFKFDDEGKLLEYREYFSPVDLFGGLGIHIPDIEPAPFASDKNGNQLRGALVHKKK